MNSFFNSFFIWQKLNKKAAFFVSGAWAVMFIIIIVNNAHDKSNYSNIALKIFAFGIAGFILGMAVFFFLKFLLIRISAPGISEKQNIRRIAILHSPLYLLLLYFMRLETSMTGSINRFLPYITGALGFLFLFNILRYVRKKYIYIACLGTVIMIIAGLPLLWIFPPRGLNAEYYGSVDFSSEPLTKAREKRISLERISSNPGSFPQKNFGIIWEGWIRIDKRGDYIFSTRSDDGSFVYINEALVVNNGGFHAPRRHSGRLYMEKGFHKIRIVYFQGDGDYEMKLFWKPPEGIERGIPQLHLYTDKPGVAVITALSFITLQLWLLSWLILLGLIICKNILEHRHNIKRLIRDYAVNTALILSAVLFILIVLEGCIRIFLYLGENRQGNLQTLLEQSGEAEFNGNERIYSLKGMVKASPHKGMVYELKPDLKGYFAGVPFFTNSRGWRDFEYSLKKGESCVRIAGLGDSCMFGWGINFNDTTMKILEKELNSRSGPETYEVMNFGVPGYNTAMETDLFINKALAYSPDIVLLHFFDNDYDTPLFMKKQRSSAALRKLYIFDFIYSRYKMLMGYYDEDTLAYSGSEENPEIMEEYRYMSGARGFANAIEKLAEITKKNGITLIVYSAKAYPGLDKSFIYYPLEEAQLELITSLSRKHGFCFVNTYPYYIRYMEDNPGMLYPMDFRLESDKIHFNTVANRIDAQALLDFFLARPELLKAR